MLNELENTRDYLKDVGIAATWRNVELPRKKGGSAMMAVVKSKKEEISGQLFYCRGYALPSCYTVD